VEDKYGALCKYVQYSFAYIVETQPEKLKCSADEQWVVFDTRLTSSFELLLEPIYMLFQKSQSTCSSRRTTMIDHRTISHGTLRSGASVGAMS
jgi:hypothetical protein